MQKKEVMFAREVSMDMDTLSRFSLEAGRFTSCIQIQYGKKAVNAKSILGLSSLAIPAFVPVLLTAEGEDEKEAILHLAQFMDQINRR